MRKILIGREVNESKLMDELLAENLINPVNEDDTSTLRDGFVFVEQEENVELVQQIIDAHDPTPLPTQPTEIEQLKINNQILAQSVYELTNIIEIMLLGGIEE